MVHARLKKLQSIIIRPHLVKKRENLLYLTGVDFIYGFLLVKPRNEAGGNADKGRPSVVFFGDGLEKIAGVKTDHLGNIGKYLAPSPSPSHKGRGTNKFLPLDGGGQVGVLEVESVLTIAEADYIKKHAKGIKIKSVPSIVDIIRAIKEKQEIVEIGRSMKLVERVFLEAKKLLAKKSFTEIGLAQFIKLRGLELGAEDVSFNPIVAAGANSAIPHHKPTKKKLKAGESIVIDMGYKVNNYCSDFTRTVFIKKVPKKLEIMYRQTALASRAAFAAAKPEMKAKDLDKIARTVLAQRGLDKYFIHSLGHGTGLEIHEWPRISEGSDDRLKNGMVFSIEPGVYIKNVGGIRIEDLVYLEGNVCKNFTNVSIRLADNLIK